MRSLGLVAFVLTLAGLSLLASPASASGPGDRNREVRQIVRDCSRDDDLDRRYGLRALRAALRRLPDDARNYTGCPRAIRRAIRDAERRLRREARRVIRDCSADDDLDRRYSVPALRRALRRLPEDAREYTDCERVIRRAIRRALRPA